MTSARVVAVAQPRSVVGGEEHVRVVGQAELLQRVENPAGTKVNFLHHVAVLDAILYTDVLVLPDVTLVGLHDPNSGKPSIVEGPVVPPPPKTVQAVDEHGVHLRHIGLGGAIDIAGELAGNPVYLPPVELASS